MKKNIFFILITLSVVFSISLSSCASKPEDTQGTTVPNPPDAHGPVTETLPQTPQETEYFYDEEVVEILGADDELTDDEYMRSIATLEDGKTVSKKEFEDDKHEILEVISELAIIMETKNTIAWLNYIDEPSKDYYKNPANLRKAQRKLPNKLIELKTIEDYFKYVFIPARKNSHIDEIRYVSKTHVKAVQVREDSDAIYYEFKKEGGKWKVYLPPVA